MTTNEIAVTVDSVVKQYGQQKVFTNLNLVIRAQTLTTIFGKSGAGKSTLLNMIGALEPFDSGTIKVFGQPIPVKNSKGALALHRSVVSYLFQNFGLIDDETVGQNLEVGLAYVKANRQEKKQLKLNALQAVHLDCRLNTKVYTLSGGEQQRIAVARILLKPSKLILADEPTGSLDPQNREIIAQLLLNLKADGKTVVIVSHDHYFEGISDQVIDLDSLQKIN